MIRWSEFPGLGAGGDHYIVVTQAHAPECLAYSEKIRIDGGIVLRKAQEQADLLGWVGGASRRDPFGCVDNVADDGISRRILEIGFFSNGKRCRKRTNYKKKNGEPTEQ